MPPTSRQRPRLNPGPPCESVGRRRSVDAQEASCEAELRLDGIDSRARGRTSPCRARPTGCAAARRACHPQVALVEARYAVEHVAGRQPWP